ncbi:MAG TPA: zf-HC2 domain-containing protein [Terriglobales bacterium]
MEHSEAVRLMAAEQYLLDELTPEQREEFEEHFFECQDCAMDVKLGATFVEYSKVILSTQPEIHASVEPAPKPSWWSAWLRPAFAVPVMAALVAFIGYQRFVTYPALRHELATATAPQLAVPLTLKSGISRGEDAQLVTVRPHQPLLLNVDVPEIRFSSYVYELYSPAGALQWSLPVSAQSIRDSVPVQAAAGEVPGAYTLVVRGVEASNSGPVEVGRYTFRLQTQQ